MKTNEFIKEYIFDKLKMKNSGFQTDKHANESIPYEKSKKQGIKEQQNWYCGNGNVVCTLKDYNKFQLNYRKLLNEEYLDIYHKLYFFSKITKNNKIYNYFLHKGDGDFSYDHADSKTNTIYDPLSKTYAIKFFNQENEICVIISENYRNNNGLFLNNNINRNKIIDNIMLYLF